MKVMSNVTVMQTGQLDVYLEEGDGIQVEFQPRGPHGIFYVHINGITVLRVNSVVQEGAKWPELLEGRGAVNV